jgi:carbon monoxide dehydrogenase subunit G
MTAYERTTTVGVGAEAAYEILADPRRLSEYVATIEHVETAVVDGDPEAEPEEGVTISPVPEARFFADRATRRIEWSDPEAGQEVSVTVAEGTASTSQVTVRYAVGDDADPAEVERLLDQTARSMRRLLSGR